MRVLLDTHVLLWLAEGSDRISVSAMESIADNENKKVLSSISLWEITIKISLGKYKIEGGFGTLVGFIEKSNFEILPISLAHLNKLLTLPFNHKDPFDRLLISTALAENIPIISADANVHQYDCTCIW